MTRTRRIQVFSTQAAYVRGGGLVQVEEVAFGGGDRCLRIANRTVDVVATLDAGPVVLRYGFAGRANMFGVLPVTDAPGWKPRGGHRLWVAPEDPVRTY